MICHSRKRSASGILLKTKIDSGQAGMTADDCDVALLLISLVRSEMCYAPYLKWAGNEGRPISKKVLLRLDCKRKVAGIGS